MMRIGNQCSVLDARNILLLIICARIMSCEISSSTVIEQPCATYLNDTA